MFPSHPFKIFPDDAPQEPVMPKRRRPENQAAVGHTHEEAGHEQPPTYLYERAYAALTELTTPQAIRPPRQSGGKSGNVLQW